MDIRSAREEMLKKAKGNLICLIGNERGKLARFVKYCKDKYDIEINQGNLSKSLAEEGKLDILTISLLCEWLNVDMQEVLWKEKAVSKGIIDNCGFSNLKKSFIMTNETKEFEKYKGTYYCYFYPTVSGEKELICGKMEVTECYYTKQCNVSIEINTNTVQEDEQKPYIKKYNGNMILSEKKQVCYCIVSNDDLGECNLIMFRHIKPNNKRYIGGMAAVLTISAGGTNVPTLHRMLISQKEILGEKRDLIVGNLYLNWSKILVKKDIFQQVLKESVHDDEVRNRILSNVKLKEVYEVQERYLRTLQDEEVAPCNRALLIARIRQVSEALKYNKISGRLDENIVEILRNI